MKRFLAAAAALFVVIAASAPASAQAINVGVKGGYNFPMGTFSDAFDGALSGGLYAEYVYSPFLALQGGWLWHKHKASNDLQSLRDFLASAEEGEATLTDTRVTMNELNFNAKLSYPLNPVTPYVLGGLGLYYWKLHGKEIQDDFDRTRDNTYWDWGVNFGGGASFRVTEQWSLGGELVYTHVFDEFDDSFFNLLLTASYSFAVPSR